MGTLRGSSIPEAMSEEDEEDEVPEEERNAYSTHRGGTDGPEVPLAENPVMAWLGWGQAPHQEHQQARQQEQPEDGEDGDKDSENEAGGGGGPTRGETWSASPRQRTLQRSPSSMR